MNGLLCSQHYKYPSKPITMVVPFAAGGATDVVARIMAERMGQILNQQVVVENVGGAGGMTGALRVARAQPEARLAKEGGGITVNHVGHIGDGNVHVVVVLAREVYTTKDTCEAQAARINLIVHEESVALDGSISAEHGIGLMHVDRLARFKPALDLELMRGVKSLFDPLGLMNPGKIFADGPR